jgi:hypothetical protein
MNNADYIHSLLQEAYPSLEFIHGLPWDETAVPNGTEFTVRGEGIPDRAPGIRQSFVNALTKRFGNGLTYGCSTVPYGNDLILIMC